MGHGVAPHYDVLHGNETDKLKVAKNKRCPTDIISSEFKTPPNVTTYLRRHNLNRIGLPSLPHNMAP